MSSQIVPAGRALEPEKEGRFFDFICIERISKYGFSVRMEKEFFVGGDSI